MATPPRTHRPLNAKQLKFVELYLATNNPVESYINAGYKGRGKSAVSGASEILSNPVVAALVEKSRQTALERLGITAERILAELGRLAFLDPRKAFNADGTPKDVHEFDDDTAACVASLEIEERCEPDSDVIVRTRKIKFWDKKGALVDLGQHFDLWNKKNATAPAGPVSLNVQLTMPPPAAVVGYLKDLGYGDDDLPRLEAAASPTDPAPGAQGDLPGADALHGNGPAQSVDSNL